MKVRFSVRAAFTGTVLAFAASHACCQEMEPRSYANTPVGLNFLIAGYGYAEGKIAFDPTLPIVDAQFRSSTEALAYVRTFDFFGKSAKFDVIVPYSSFSGQALVGGETRVREIAGLGDPRFRVSMNFFGAPALTMKEFASYRQDLIIGASVQVLVPLGQYDNSKLINLGNNRWSVRAELGLSKAIGPWTIEVAPSILYFTDNTDFNYGRTLSQAPLYIVQGHLLYNFPSGVWLGLNGLYYSGGRTALDGLNSDNLQTNTRVGLTLAVPINRHNSVKFTASTDVSTRTGSEFSLYGVAWQYRWGDGL